jgi:hypothetical protein
MRTPIFLQIQSEIILFQQFWWPIFLVTPLAIMGKSNVTFNQTYKHLHGCPQNVKVQTFPTCKWIKFVHLVFTMMFSLECEKMWIMINKCLFDIDKIWASYSFKRKEYHSIQLWSIVWCIKAILRCLFPLKIVGIKSHS